MKIMLSTIFFLFLCLFFQEKWCYPQIIIDKDIENKSLNSPFMELYNKVLDRVFYYYPAKGFYSQFALVLRFLPTFHPASQIVIRYYSRSQIVINYKYAIHQMTFAPDYDIDKIAKRMDVQTNIMTVNAQTFDPWFEGFWNAYKNSFKYFKDNSMSNLMQFDGTEYYLDYFGPQNHILFSIEGSEVNEVDKHDPPIVQWMISIKKEIDKLVANANETK
jgi:hypothetical protein